MHFLKLILAAALAILAGCSAVEPSRYADQKPALDLQQYFNGTLDAQGMFQDRSGAVVKRFAVVIVCSWKGDVGTLDEDFTYSDGTRQRRIWTLTKTGASTYTGTAADVIGQAEGVVAGNALRWKYVLALPVDGKIINVDMEDWMYLMDQRVMLNRAAMSKYGFHVGDVTLSFTKRP
ncbi:hypothetical protein RCH09_000009 [Actimicrobium sp. GrIS 1.19]|uniref:DUF3833 domain-containing protein n=1 Tax=Actimicrobium sp. GrIS 1.19 TaxID=3071708 RepID=UPI002E04BA7C|nr:hypothetical protein [Actimicrobium sp. GrIS 1.19]